MKKLLLTCVLSLFYISSASAVSVNVGVSGQAGLFAASASEKDGTTVKGNGTEHGSAGWGSVFLEGQFGDKILVGVDYVPAALETDTVETNTTENEVNIISFEANTIPNDFIETENNSLETDVNIISPENIINILNNIQTPDSYYTENIQVSIV